MVSTRSFALCPRPPRSMIRSTVNLDDITTSRKPSLRVSVGGPSIRTVTASQVPFSKSRGLQT